MQADRSAGAARLAGSVRGLGVCDVLRIEFRAVQREGLVAAVHVRIAALERRRRRLTAATGGRAERIVDADEPKEVGEQLRLLRRIRASVPERPSDPFALAGPAGIISTLVGDCLAGAVRDLAAQLGEGGTRAPGAAVRDAQLEAASAWIATALECRAVESFCFDTGLDPAHAW